MSVRTAYRLVGFKSGLKLHVVPVREDVAEGRLIRAKHAFSRLVVAIKREQESLHFQPGAH